MVEEDLLYLKLELIASLDNRHLQTVMLEAEEVFLEEEEAEVEEEASLEAALGSTCVQGVVVGDAEGLQSSGSGLYWKMKNRQSWTKKSREHCNRSSDAGSSARMLTAMSSLSPS